MPKGYGRPASKPERRNTKFLNEMEKKYGSDKDIASARKGGLERMDSAMKYRQERAQFDKDVLVPVIRSGAIKPGVRDPNAAVVPEFKKGGLVKKGRKRII